MVRYDPAASGRGCMQANTMRSLPNGDHGGAHRPVHSSLGSVAHGAMHEPLSCAAPHVLHARMEHTSPDCKGLVVSDPDPVAFSSTCATLFAQGWPSRVLWVPWAGVQPDMCYTGLLPPVTPDPDTLSMLGFYSQAIDV